MSEQQNGSETALLDSVRELTGALLQHNQLLMALIEQNDQLIQAMAEQEEVPTSDLSGRPLWGGPL